MLKKAVVEVGTYKGPLRTFFLALPTIFRRLRETASRREKLRKEFDPERNELFFARHVILVEGDTEKLAIPAYASRLSINLDREGCSIVEVGGKRNLKEFIEIVSSFGISLTVVFDTDSTDFGKTPNMEEETYNNELRELDCPTIRIVELNPKYETVLRREIGEASYQALCQNYSGFTKAVKHRLIAVDDTYPVPPFAKRILSKYF